MNILQAINNANKKLKERGIKTYHLDSQILISESLKEKKNNILLNLEQEIPIQNLDYFDFLVKERIKKKTYCLYIKKKRILEI